MDLVAGVGGSVWDWSGPLNWGGLNVCVDVAATSTVPALAPAESMQVIIADAEVVCDLMNHGDGDLLA